MWQLYTYYSSCSCSGDGWFAVYSYITGSFGFGMVSGTVAISVVMCS